MATKSHDRQKMLSNFICLAIVSVMNSARAKLNRSSKKLLSERRNGIDAASRALSLAKAALVIVGDLAAITVTSFWPHPYYHAFCDHRKKSFRATLSRMRRQGFIEGHPKEKDFFILTKRGEDERAKALRQIAVEKSKGERWDGKWRILIFDIPEKQRKLRDFLRAESVNYGFEPLQKSVFISPFRVAEEFKETLEYRDIEKWVKLIVSDTIFEDEDLETKFNLQGD